MGHRTHAVAMRNHFVSSEDFRLYPYWLDEEREFGSRVLARALAWQPCGFVQSINNRDLWRFRAELAYGFLGRRLAVRKIKYLKTAILHFHTQVPACLSAHLMRNHLTVVTGDMTAVQISRENVRAPAWTYKPNVWLDGRTFRNAAHVSMWSEWARGSVIRDYGVDSSKTSVIYPGVEISMFPEPTIDRSIRQGRIKLLFVGSDFIRKGGEDLVEVFLDNFSDIAELHLITNHRSKKVHPRIHWHRDVQAYSSEWRTLYQNADLFVLPTYREAFGLAIVEAMAAGLPVIATNINAIPEMVVDNETGFLISPGDKTALAHSILMLIVRPDMRSSFGRAGRLKAIKQFDSTKNFDTLGTVFRKLGSRSTDDLHNGPP